MDRLARDYAAVQGPGVPSVRDSYLLRKGALPEPTLDCREGFLGKLLALLDNGYPDEACFWSCRCEVAQSVRGSPIQLYRYLLVAGIFAYLRLQSRPRFVCYCCQVCNEPKPKLKALNDLVPNSPSAM